MDRTKQRRRFLKAAASAAAAGPMLSCGGVRRWRFFRDDEAATLGALCEQIIPADDYPGAVEAGVVNFIDRQLVGHYKRFQETYRRGLALLEAASFEKCKQKFTQLSFAEQTRFLNELTGELKQFFDLVIAHTMQGFYGDPRHGGNRDAVSYRMLGLPLSPVRGRDQYDLTQLTDRSRT